MKFLSTAIAAYRCFSTKTSAKYPRGTQLKNKKKYRVNESKTPKRPRIKWTEEQTQILDTVSSGESVFITGSAGTGKTALLQQIIKILNEKHTRSRVFKTASTGVAACALKGQTLHSFSGVGLADAEPEILLDRVLSNKKAYSRWVRVRALVIDEIGLIDAKYFDTLEFIARVVKSEEAGVEDEIWGGIQLVVTGDFFQLPPIPDRSNLRRRQFAFEADCWDSSFRLQVEVKKIFRQSDTNLIKLLQNIRLGKIDPEDLELLEKHCSEKEPDSSAVQLYPMTEDVNRVNKNKMESLHKSVRVYSALDSGDEPWTRQLKQGIAPDELMLAVGARVMLCMNFNPWRKLVNGSTGTVTKFCNVYDKGVLPVVKFDSGIEMIIEPQTWVVTDGDKVVAKRKQLPLILAWALSIHKCQGMSIDNLHTDLSRAFDFGMVYVALSRVRSLDGLHLSGFDPSKIKAHPKVLEFYQRFCVDKDKKEEDDDASDKTIHIESDTNPSFVLHCKPNASLVSWYNTITKNGCV
ncbi:ATP-dependent DNA helicase [Actinidia chinensis var. chinensis]|uniref:ATP-dependent DNA helicase n=1 Tax=Actinidia chinensis var. chinensis TaxID=1590841 RepID=A0A2R6QX92_ACTCC|nr:ATP-dependent DNA helicase [Actinidia chinensis var. chinensis]